MSSEKFLEMSKEVVAKYTNEHTDATDNGEKMTADDVYVVWYCKTLQNHKALLSTPRPDGMYYEMTYNGDREEAYLDAYKKFSNEKLELTGQNQ